MYAGRVDRIEIEVDETGFVMYVLTDEGQFSFNIHDVSEKLYDTVKAAIGPWLREKEEARRPFVERAFACDPDESGGYDVSDPKHSAFHSTHADIWDNREGK